MVYKVLTRSTDNCRWRTYSEYDSLTEALAVAKRLENNTSLEVVVDLPEQELQTTWSFDNTLLRF